MRTHAIATLAAIATLTLAALVSTPAASQTPAPKAAAQKGAPKAPAAIAPRNTLAKLRATKTINIAFSADSLPFSFVDSKQQPAGYSIDLCKRVVVQLGRAAGVDELKINWIVGSAAERVEMVASGKADIDCANTTATQARMALVDFSSLIFLDGGGFLVKGTALQKFTDFNGKNVGVIAGTTTEQRLDAALKQRLINANFTKVRDGNEGLAMLESGSIDAFASDKIKLIGLAAQAKDPKPLSVLQDDLSIEPLAFALPRGDSAMRLEVNRALTQVYVGGDIETIFNAHLGALGRPSGLLAAMYLLNAIPQ